MPKLRAPGFTLTVGRLLGGCSLLFVANPALSQNATSASYQYDGLGRLKAVNYGLSPTSGSSSITIRLDAAGNRTPPSSNPSTPPLPGMQTSGSNYAPVGRVDAFSTAPLVPIVLDVLANDTDPNGEPLSIAGFTIPTQGTMTQQGNVLIYKPNAGTNNQTHTFTYALSDGTSALQYVTSTIDVKELIPVTYNPSTNYGNFTGTNSGGVGMRDAFFGDLWPQYATTHATTAAGWQYIYTDFQGFYFVNKLVLSPIATGFPDPNVRGKEFLNGVAVNYNDTTNCTGAWKYADNLSVAIDNGYVVLNMADVVAQCVAVSMLPPVSIGLSEIRYVGQPTGPSGFRAPAGGDGSAAKVSLPFFRRAIFEDELARRRAKLKGEISLGAASAPGGSYALDLGGGSSAGLGAQPGSPPASGINVASLTPGNVPFATASDPNDSELIPKSFTSSSTLSDAFGGLAAEGMRDGDFASTRSTFQTSISSTEYVIADLGVEKPVSRVDLAPLASQGARALDGAAVYTSTDCQRWTWGGEIKGEADGAYASVTLNGAPARCIKVEVSGSYLGLGDFRIF